MSAGDPPSPDAEFYPESLPAKLNTLKLRSGVKNDNEFAKLAGVSRSSMSQYLNGKQIPRPPVLHRLAKATGADIEWLLGQQMISIEMKRATPAATLEGHMLDDAMLDAPVNFFLLALSFQTCKEFFQREAKPMPTLREALSWISGPYSLHATIPDVDFRIVQSEKPA